MALFGCGSEIVKTKSMEGLQDTTLKRERDDKSSNDIVVSFAFSVVRLSGLTNMLAAEYVSTFVMCVLALWQRSDLALFLNDDEHFRVALVEWCEQVEEMDSDWEAGAAAMPYGRDYLAARNTELQTESLEAYKTYWKHHDPDGRSGWAEHLVEYAKLACLDAAVFARDIAEVKTLENVFDDHALMKTAAMSCIVGPSFFPRVQVAE
jgi:hypothetical protein